MTNADIIRKMTDEQLFEFLSEWELGDIDYAITFCDLCEQSKREGGKGNELGLDCDGCREHFLKVDADGYLGLNGWLWHNGFEPYREGGDAISRLYTLKAMCAECDVKCEDGTNKEAHCTEYAIVKGMPPVNQKQITGKLKNPCDSLLTEDSESVKEQKSKLESDTISRQAAIDAVEKAVFKGVAKSSIESLPPVEPKRSELHIDEPRGYTLKTDKAKAYSERPKGEWVPCTEPPEDRRNVFLAHGTNDFKSCCIGHYEQGMGWYEDRNFFAKPIYDCKYWCDIPELPDMGDNQFDMRGDKE